MSEARAFTPSGWEWGREAAASSASLAHPYDIFQWHIFLPSYIVHGVLTISVLELSAIPSSSGSRVFRILHHELSI